MGKNSKLSPKKINEVILNKTQLKNYEPKKKHNKNAIQFISWPRRDFILLLLFVGHCRKINMILIALNSLTQNKKKRHTHAANVLNVNYNKLLL